MTWSRFDDRTRRHPKVVRAGNEAASFWAWSVLYSNEYGLDGFIADDVLHMVPPVPITPKKARELAEKCVAAVARPGGLGLFERAEGGYRIHDIEDFQPSSQESTQRREKRAQSGRLGGIRSGVARRSKNEASASLDTEANIEANASSLALKQTPFALNPVPSRPEDPPTPLGIRETARRAFGEGIRTVVDGPPFVLRDDEADVLMRIIADDATLCGLRGEGLAQRIRRLAADYAKDRASDAKYERGLSPSKFAEWYRTRPLGVTRKRPDEIAAERIREAQAQALGGGKS